MDYFPYQDGKLHCESVPLDDIATNFGTPCYVYSRAAIENQWRAFSRPLAAYEHLLCYAVKANSNLGVLSLLAHLNSGFDIVSIGELERVIVAGGNPKKVVFSGVGKRSVEIRRALEVNIHCFNVESREELERINYIAQEMNLRAPIALRVNPDIDAGTHPYISTGLKENKFGISLAEAEENYLHAAQLPNLQLLGIACHIGSQITALEPFIEALTKILGLVDKLKQYGIILTHVDIGGGLGINYNHEQPPHPKNYVDALRKTLHNRPLTLIIEPGRAIVGNAGILLTRVEYLKHTHQKNFAIVDAAMNDLIRPALYHAWQNILPVNPHIGLTPQCYDIVGPICETSDFLGRDRHLALIPHDLLVICSAGAYGFSMSSNYNSRPRATEIIVDNTKTYCVRRRESIAELYAGESLFPFR